MKIVFHFHDTIHIQLSNPWLLLIRLFSIRVANLNNKIQTNIMQLLQALLQHNQFVTALSCDFFRVFLECLKHEKKTQLFSTFYIPPGERK